LYNLHEERILSIGRKLPVFPALNGTFVE
jgi:hypothetical protein